MSDSESRSLLAEFQLSGEEAFVLAVAKFWLASRDQATDPDEDDQTRKRPPVHLYGLELHRAFEQEQAFDAAVEPTRDVLLARLGQPGWPAALRRSLGNASVDDAWSVMRHWSFVSGLLSTITRRQRAVLLCVELAAFNPWPSDVKFEKGPRQDNLKMLCGAMGAPLGHNYIEDIDRALRRKAFRLALRNTNWMKVGAIVAGGAVLGAITGGLAAPFIGGAIGGGMGLSGAAAANAGLALLGGGSLAAGGFGVAGGTFVVAGVAGVGAGTVVGGGTIAHQMSTAQVFADLVKLDVLTEYMLIREQSEPAKVRTVVRMTEQSLRASEAQLSTMRQRLEELDQVVELQQATEQLLIETETERDELRAEVKTQEQVIKLLKAELSSLHDKTNGREDA